MYHHCMIRSLDSILIFVSDLSASLDFYQKLGFGMEKHDSVGLARLGDFVIHLVDEKHASENGPAFKQEAEIKPRGAGIYTYVHVERIDLFYKEIVKSGIKPSSEPKDWPWGNREFAVRDPDGYKYIFYEPHRPDQRHMPKAKLIK